MINLGLSAANLAALTKTFTAPAYRSTLSVQIADISGHVLSNVSALMTDGQIDVDNTADVTRSLSLTLTDASGTLPFDTNSPADTALYFDREIWVDLKVVIAQTTTVVTIPLFRGPVTKLDRTGASVSVEAQGREVYYMGSVWTPVSYPAGRKKTDVIRGLLASGNRMYKPLSSWLSIPSATATIGKPVQLAQTDAIWTTVRTLAAGMSQQLFWDAAGICRLRPSSTTIAWTFQGVSGPANGDMQIGYSDNVVNAVYVIGGTPKGAKNPVTATAVAASTHPLSPQRVGRYILPGGGAYEDDTILTTKDAKAKAQQLLTQDMLQTVTVSFDAVPMWLLDPLDTCRVITNLGTVTFSLQKFSIPLNAGEPMSIGYNRDLSVAKTVRKNVK